MNENFYNLLRHLHRATDDLVQAALNTNRREYYTDKRLVVTQTCWLEIYYELLELASNVE